MKKTSLFWIILGAAGVLGLGYWWGSSDSRLAEEKAVPAPVASPVIEPTTEEIEPVITATTSVRLDDGQIAYTNAEHDFSLTLPERWENYRVTKRADAQGDHYEFELPSTRGGYGSIFVIGAYPAAVWETLQAETIKPVYLGERDDIIFGYSLGQDDEGFAGFPEAQPGLAYKGPLFDAQEIILPSFELK